MVMAPLDLRNREFRKAFRGYVEDEVDSFLEQVVTDYEHLFRENLNLQDRLAQQEDNLSHYRHLEDTLKSTLVVAQKTAEDVRSAAEKESMTMLANAGREVELQRKEAEAKAETIIKEAQERAKAIVQEYGEIQKQAVMFKVSLRSLLQAQVELLNQNFLTVEAVSEQGNIQELSADQAAAGQQGEQDNTRVFLKEPRYVPTTQGD